MLNELLDQALGFRPPRFFSQPPKSPITDLPSPSSLCFALISGDGRPWSASVKVGDEVKPGHFLAHDGSRPVLVSPVLGKVTGVVPGSDLRGAGAVSSLVLEPDPASSPVAFPGLDPAQAPVEQLWARLDEAGVLTASHYPRPLSEVIGPAAGIEVHTLIVSAIDRDAEVSCQGRLFRERTEPALAAASLLGRMAGAKRTLIAVEPGLVPAVNKHGSGLEVLPVSAEYPNGLEPLLALRAGGAGVRVVAVETALAALGAVQSGAVQDKKVVTYISPSGQARANYRVPLGMSFQDLFAAAGLSPRDRDKVLAGGPLRGFALFSLAAAVDQGVDAFMLVPHESQIAWTNDPCISCGACILVCPVNLQPQMLGRFSEFGQFDRAEDFAIEHCIECGLCASVCTARRPLIQWIRLAKRELSKKKAAEQIKPTEADAEVVDDH